jgi:uncharacterized delta-60 repeat protein
MRVLLLWWSFIGLAGFANGQNPVLDLSFDAGESSNGYLTAAAIQEDGRIVVGGQFTTFQGLPRSGVVRLLPDGTLDQSFSAVPLASGDVVYALAVDALGRILIAGFFYDFDGTTGSHIARLLPDGTRDPSFVIGLGADYYVNDILLQADGRILLCGNFHTFNGIPRRGIARLLPNGSLDVDFVVGSGFSTLQDPGFPYVISMALDGAGGIIVGGMIDTYNGVTAGPLVRLGPTGIRDVSFAPEFGPWWAAIHNVCVVADGRIRVTGDFEMLYGLEQGGIAGLLATGERDSLFVQGVSIVEYGNMLIQDGDGMILVGDFTSYHNHTRMKVARMDLNGFVDQGYDCGWGVEGDLAGIWTLARQPDSRMIMVGNFQSFNGIERIDVLRLGIATDCVGTPGGLAMPGTPCDDGLLFTTNDTWTAECVCQGYDCLVVQGGVALPGTPCDDGTPWTYNDTWTITCECQGVGEVGVTVHAAEQAALVISPNPATDEGVAIWLGLPTGTSAHIGVLDPTGRELRFEKVVAPGASPIMLPTSGLSSGVHLIRVTSLFGRSVGRLIVN